MKTPKIGRPELPADERQGKITAVRLREDERALIERAAAKNAQRLSEWIRTTVLKAARKQTRGNEDS